jgi:cytochrome c oxidase assembly protein subunit 15
MQSSAQRAIALWLFALCFMILVMVALGGATRLTGSGLSIMEWAPIMGTMPPLSEAEWQRLFHLYQQIPQYSLLNQGIGIGGFKHIFWLEWVHRFWGRLMGVALIGPLLWFGLRGAMPAWLWRRMALLLVLGALQGGVGWFMVASGFEPDSTAVSPYRLVAHLALALGLYAALFWTALRVWSTGQPRLIAVSPTLRRLSMLLLGAVALTILAGGFVAGLKAGLTYNTFPLMDGHVVPQGWAALEPWWRNLLENIPAVQFDHRLLATATAFLALFTTAFGMQLNPPPALRVALRILATAAGLQYLLGVATLLYVVPVGLATLHQACAVLLLSSALLLRHQLRG